MSKPWSNNEKETATALRRCGESYEAIGVIIHRTEQAVKVFMTRFCDVRAPQQRRPCNDPSDMDYWTKVKAQSELFAKALRKAGAPEGVSEKPDTDNPLKVTADTVVLTKSMLA